MTEKKHIDVSVIEAYVEGSISLKQASIMLERTPRTIMRLAAKYRDFGADGLVHGNTGKEPHNKIDSSTREKILGVMQQESLRQCLTAWLFVIFDMKASKYQLRH